MMTTEQTKAEQLQEIGKRTMDCIREMVAALECDYDRLEELRDDCPPEDAEELSELIEAAGDCESVEDARERIMNDPLSLQVRSGWHAPGAEMEPEEFELLLATGGPAVRIIGELGTFSEPETAILQVQDWFVPWTDYRSDSDEDDALLTYVQHFCFDE